jgi:hypothetical protein
MKLVNQARCRRCGRGMEQVAEIAPFGREPGLVAFLCSDCGATESTLIYPKDERKRADRPAAHGQP